MIVKTIESDNGTIVVVVDSELLNKKFEEGDKQLDLTSDFYKGEKKTEEDVGDILRNAYVVNIVGEKSIKLAVKEGVVDESYVKKIAGIPYIQGIVG